MEKEIIVKVRENKSNKQKIVTIPSDTNIKCDDYVKIVKINGFIEERLKDGA